MMQQWVIFVNYDDGTNKYVHFNGKDERELMLRRNKWMAANPRYIIGEIEAPTEIKNGQNLHGK